ncbi:unnamed protein product [Sphagnum troendelagicum]
MVSSASSGSMLPLQLIFQGKTTAMVPNHVEAREAVRKGWDLTNSENHWSNQTTMKRFVEKVLDPWRIEKCKELGLDSSKQKMFEKWQSELVASQLAERVRPEDVELQVGIKKLRELLIGWLLLSWGELCEQVEMIQKGWALCRLGSIHIPCFQDAAMG